MYHYRETTEQPSLHEVILDSVQSDELRQEVLAMKRTGADVLREEGELRGMRRTLLRQLRQLEHRIRVPDSPPCYRILQSCQIPIAHSRT